MSCLKFLHTDSCCPRFWVWVCASVGHQGFCHPGCNSRRATPLLFAVDVKIEIFLLQSQETHYLRLVGYWLIKQNPLEVPVLNAMITEFTIESSKSLLSYVTVFIQPLLRK